MTDMESLGAALKQTNEDLRKTESQIDSLELTLGTVIRMLSIEDGARAKILSAAMKQLQDSLPLNGSMKALNALAMFEDCATKDINPAAESKIASNDAINEMHSFTIGVRTSMLLIVGALAHDPDASHRMATAMEGFLTKETSRIRPDVRQVMDEFRKSVDPGTWVEPKVH